jgi:hypothetical protein
VVVEVEEPEEITLEEPCAIQLISLEGRRECAVAPCMLQQTCFVKTTLFPCCSLSVALGFNAWPT